MTKEEYLNMYKEDKLAEICAQLEEENDNLTYSWEECRKNFMNANQKAIEFSEVWDDVDNLFEKIKKIPAQDFIKLYYQMKEVIENKVTNKNITYIPDLNN